MQWKGLALKLRGHYAYFGIAANIAALARFHHEVTRTWRKWLSTRSRDGRLSWAKMTAVLGRFPLPAPRIVHGPAS
jgi:hypothetical protein